MVKIQKNATLNCTYDPVDLIPFVLFIKIFKNITRIHNPKIQNLQKKSKNPESGD